jgi:hypothetical protein
MIVVTDKEMRDSLAQHEELQCEGDHLRFDHPEARAICVDLHVQEPHQLVHLARLVAHLRYDEIDFHSASLWITQSGVWNNLDEAVAFTALERFRQRFGENRSLDAAPGHLFRHDEFVESVACLPQPMLIGWDPYYVPRWAWGRLDYFIFVSHDCFLHIETRTKDMYDASVEILKTRGWLKFGDHPPDGNHSTKAENPSSPPTAESRLL